MKGRNLLGHRRIKDVSYSRFEESYRKFRTYVGVKRRGDRSRDGSVEMVSV